MIQLKRIDQEGKKILQSRIEGNIRYIDDILVYHTGKEKIAVEIKQLFGTNKKV